ncbi:hypothetical protein DV515_00013267 [Chloebia gouldiae]|uniref:Uncharacterized protein n=1 Tax=Chloebia gouldiae TaxID=44316 RepID=A0A3L8S1Y1_CHLGU|nr:hypothetical protein DV515_00013267 [Chloebia gouldiae]
MGQPRTPEPPSSCWGGQSCLCPHPPLLPSLHSPVQKLVFNRVNGKRPPLLLQQISAPEECYTLAHEENVRFVYEGEGRGSLGQHPGELEQMESLPSIYTMLGTSVAGMESPAWGLALLCSTSCSCPTAPHIGNPHPKPMQRLFPLPSLAAGRAAAGRQPERGEHLRPRAVCGENPQPRTQK